LISSSYSWKSYFTVAAALLCLKGYISSSSSADFSSDSLLDVADPELALSSSSCSPNSSFSSDPASEMLDPPLSSSLSDSSSSSSS
jgi:hypothetical protein